jgi:hypothetical protein
MTAVAYCAEYTEKVKGKKRLAAERRMRKGVSTEQ